MSDWFGSIPPLFPRSSATCGIYLCRGREGGPYDKDWPRAPANRARSVLHGGEQGCGLIETMSTGHNAECDLAAASPQPAPAGRGAQRLVQKREKVMPTSGSMRTQIGTLVLATSFIQLANGFFGTFISMRVAIE